MWNLRRAKKASALPWEVRFNTIETAEALTSVYKGQSVTQCGGYIIVLGGGFSINNAMLDIPKREWVRLDQDFAATFHSASLVDDRIILVGGVGVFSNFLDNIVTVYDTTLRAYVFHQRVLRSSAGGSLLRSPFRMQCRLAANARVYFERPQDMPRVCCKHIAEYFERKREVVIFGGGGADGEFLDQFYALDVDSMEWRRLQSKGQNPGRQSSHSSCLQGERMFVFCNYNDPALSNIFVCDYSGTMPHWSCLKTRGNTPPGLYPAALNLMGNRLILFGGCLRGAYAQSLYVFDIPSGVWSAGTYNVHKARKTFRFLVVDPKTSHVGRHHGFYCNGKILYFGGIEDEKDVLFELEVVSLNV